MRSITRSDWLAMSGVERSDAMRVNLVASKMSLSKRDVVCGVARNDADYVTNSTIDGERIMCPAYRDWKSMIMRCYSNKYKSTHPTYIGVSACSEWLSFMAFRSWWLLNVVDGWQLDKDLLGDGKTYSPESCIYIPQWLNSFVNDNGASRGVTPIGVSFYSKSGMYRASCNNTRTRNVEHIGMFSSADEAHMAWRKRKILLAKSLKCDMDEIDGRLYSSVVAIIESLR